MENAQETLNYLQQRKNHYYSYWTPDEDYESLKEEIISDEEYIHKISMGSTLPQPIHRAIEELRNAYYRTVLLSAAYKILSK